MNDLCSRFLEVLDSEVDTFWSFSCYMEKFSKDFRADGLHRKIGEVTENRYVVVQFSDPWWSNKEQASQASAVKIFVSVYGVWNTL